MQIKIDSKAVEQNFLKAVARAHLTGMQGVSAVVDKILAESDAQVPRHSGALAQSKFKIVYKKHVNFGYGGPNAQVNDRGELTDSYAVRQHEDLSLEHPNGGKAKFLEDPVRSHQMSILREIANHIKFK